jgi:hypothetical protein
MPCFAKAKAVACPIPRICQIFVILQGHFGASWKRVGEKPDAAPVMNAEPLSNAPAIFVF